MTPTRSVFLGASLALLACSPKKGAPPIPNSALLQAADPKLIVMTAEPTTTLVGAIASTELGVRIQIRASALPNAHRPKLNLALVLDTSGSMDGDTIAALRSSAHKVVSQMRDGDRVSVIAFHSRVDMLAPNTVLDVASRARIGAAINQITARGTTDLAAGLTAGLQQVQRGRFPTGINRIVLLSDGVPNTSQALPALIATARTEGIGIAALGLGNDYDSTLMTKIARDTGGNFHYIEKPDAVAAVFDNELSRMSTVVGRNLRLVLSPGPGVTIQPMPGLQVMADGRVHATVGDLAAGETRDLMIPVKLASRADGAIAELVDVQLVFDDVIGHSGRLHRDAFVSVKASNDKAAVAAAVKIDLEVQRVRTAAASAILEAIALARGNQLDAARNKLLNAAVIVRAASTRLKDPQLSAIATQIDEVAKQLAELVRQPTVAKVSVDDAPGLDDHPGKKPSKKRKQADHDDVPAVAPSPVIEKSLRRAEENASRSVTGR